MQDRCGTTDKVPPSCEVRACIVPWSLRRWPALRRDDAASYGRLERLGASWESWNTPTMPPLRIAAYRNRCDTK